MTTKPIIFSGPMVQALLDGRKTQTRRIAKPDWKDGASQDFSDWRPERIAPNLWFLKCTRIGATIKTAYAPGDLLWVREAWRTEMNYDDWPPRDLYTEGVGFHYEADGGEVETWGKKRPGIFLPRWASRLTLRVTDVRVQRVQEISEADAVDEGVTVGGEQMPTDHFRDLWDSLNAKRGFGWDANPWVAAYTFEVIRKNVDEVPPEPYVGGA